MRNGRKRMRGTFAGLALALASLTAAPAAAQSGSGTGDPSEPTYCYSEEGKTWYPCCNRWDACGTQYWVDAPPPPKEPSVRPEE